MYSKNIGIIWDLYQQLLKTSFKLRYRGSILGFVWVFIKPFMIFGMLFIIFSSTMSSSQNLSSGEYAVYLLLGLIVFSFFQEGIIWGMNSLLDKSHIILKVNFNKVTAVISSISLAVINLVINLSILTGVLIFVGLKPSFLSICYAIIVMFVLLLLIIGISFYTSIILIRLRDLTHITELVMQLLFYASAVFFPIELVPEQWRFIIVLNPIAASINAVRSALIHNEIVRTKYIAIIFVVAFLLILSGLKFFNKKVRKVAEYF